MSPVSEKHHGVDNTYTGGKGTSIAEAPAVYALP